METVDMIQSIAAVLVGNALTALVAYTVYRATKLERKGGNADQLPFSLLFATLVPFGLVFWAFYLL